MSFTGHLTLTPFDATIPLKLFLWQTDIVTQVNGWSKDTTAHAIVSQLQGPALKVLSHLAGTEITYTAALRGALEDRLGDRYLQLAYYGKLRGRWQQCDESLQELAADVEWPTQK